MASESLQAASASAARPKHAYRLRFQKCGDLRLVSHIDLLHVFERMLRRAAIPFASTQGFHPKACLVFAQALALGVAGLREVVEMELLEALDAAELVTRLNRHAPAGLVFLSAVPVPAQRSLHVRRAFYRLVGLDHESHGSARSYLPVRCRELLSRQHCVVERARPRPRLIDIRPYLCELQADDSALTMSLWITPYGAARPEEVVKTLGLGALLDDGAVIERTDLELMDEIPESERWLPEIPRLADAAVAAEPVLAGAAPERVAPAAEPLLANPLSFET